MILKRVAKSLVLEQEQPIRFNAFDKTETEAALFSMLDFPEETTPYTVTLPYFIFGPFFQFLFSSPVFVTFSSVVVFPLSLFFLYRCFSSVIVFPLSF